jgi:integrase
MQRHSHQPTRSPTPSPPVFLSEGNDISGSQRGANGDRRLATSGDARRRLVQSAGVTGDIRRRPATVRLRLTSEGSLVRTQLRPPGTPLDRHNVLREFRRITQAAALGADWVPQEMRHTFVSLLSANGTALEDIADLVGHRGTATTETVYRKVIVPELRRGAEVMDRLFT